MYSCFIEILMHSFILNLRLKFLGTYESLSRIKSIANLDREDEFQAAQIDKCIEFAGLLLSGPKFESACKQLDDNLGCRTFFVASSLSSADIVVWLALSGTAKRWESLRKSNKYENLARWFNSILGEYGDVLNEVAASYLDGRGCLGKPIGSQANQQQLKSVKGNISDKGKAGSKATTSEVDLPDAEIGKVRLRFAPEPSGYLHIGHARAAYMNHYFAQRYQGQLILRFDDTNPEKESNEFVDNILKDVQTLGIKYDQPVTYTSTYFPQLMEMAENLIRRGKAYIDDTPAEQIMIERGQGIESKCRNNSMEENIKLWKEMMVGSDRGKQCCVRGRLDMQNPKKCLRDPVYYRPTKPKNSDGSKESKPMPHHRFGFEYKIYPTYDFCCPFVDSIEGITHALRSSEYFDRNAQYHRIQEDMGLRKVHIYEFSRLNMEHTVLSKRKLLWFVQQKKVKGWNDPRFPTVQGMVRAGLQVEALKQFILELGPSKNLNLMEWDKLWTINKKVIDPVCPRHTAVIEERRVLLTLTNGPEKPFVRIIPKHKKFEGAGEKETTYTRRIWLDRADAESITVDEEVTLMDWGNAVVKKIEKNQDGNLTLTGVLHTEGSVKTTKLKLTWLPATDDLVKLSLVEFGYLISKKKLEKKEELSDRVLNPCTEWETAALGDSNMRNLKCGDILQLERKGYFRCDVAYTTPSQPIVLFAVPDGRQKTSLKCRTC